MPDRLPDAVHDKLSKRLSYYEDIGIRLFYRDRSAILPNDANPTGTRPRPILPGPTTQQEPGLGAAVQASATMGMAAPTPQE
jgi:hypothetical protein